MAKVAFMDFELETGDVTLSPRFETEILVEKAIGILSEKFTRAAPCDVLDMGTGCGNVAISLTNYLPSSRIVALDVSDTALSVARKNASRYDAENRIEFVKSDLFENIWPRHDLFFDLIISNPPYVALSDFNSLPDNVKDDPYLALYGGVDGMEFYRRIIKDTHFFLKQNGILLMEIGHDQAAGIKTILDAAGVFGEIETYKDYSGRDRIIKAAFRGPGG